MFINVIDVPGEQRWPAECRTHNSLRWQVLCRPIVYTWPWSGCY